LKKKDRGASGGEEHRNHSLRYDGGKWCAGNGKDWKKRSKKEKFPARGGKRGLNLGVIRTSEVGQGNGKGGTRKKNQDLGATLLFGRIKTGRWFQGDEGREEKRVRRGKRGPFLVRGWAVGKLQSEKGKRLPGGKGGTRRSQHREKKREGQNTRKFNNPNACKWGAFPTSFGKSTPSVRSIPREVRRSRVAGWESIGLSWSMLLGKKGK